MLCLLLGVHECTFRIEKTGIFHAIVIGICPADKIGAKNKCLGNGIGYVLDVIYWEFWCPKTDGSGDGTYRNIGETGSFNRGDPITVKVDLDARKMSFKKNGTDSGTPQDIPSGTYFFACDIGNVGDAVTVIERK